MEDKGLPSDLLLHGSHNIKDGNFQNGMGQCSSTSYAPSTSMQTDSTSKVMRSEPKKGRRR